MQKQTLFDYAGTEYAGEVKYMEYAGRRRHAGEDSEVVDIFSSGSSYILINITVGHVPSFENNIAFGLWYILH